MRFFNLPLPVIILLCLAVCSSRLYTAEAADACPYAPDPLKPVKFWPYGFRYILFYVRAQSGVNLAHEFIYGKSHQWSMKYDDISSLFRSSQLDNFRRALDGSQSNRIVVEMRKLGKIVASATFDVSDRSTLKFNNWFTKERLVASYPFWVGDKSNLKLLFQPLPNSRYTISIEYGDPSGSCRSYSALMFIAFRTSKICAWVQKAGSGTPSFVYARCDKPLTESGDSADELIIYSE